MSMGIFMRETRWALKVLSRIACILPLSLASLMPATASAQQAAQNAANPPPAAPPAPPTEAETSAAGTPATVIDGQQVESLLGKTVDSAKGENMGRIIDVLVDKKGQIRAAVVDFGGFFGVGSRKIAIDWNAIHFKGTDTSGAVVVDMPSDQLRVAPIYKEGEPVVVLGTRPTGDAKPPASNAAPSAQTSATPPKTP